MDSIYSNALFVCVQVGVEHVLGIGSATGLTKLTANHEWKEFSLDADVAPVKYQP
jgi:hypothetical protein